MPKRIPIESAKQVAREQGCRQVILVAWDGEKTHVVTYGVSDEDCSQAAIGGNKIVKALGWPESLCNAEPSRVKALKGLVRHAWVHSAYISDCGYSQMTTAQRKLYCKIIGSTFNPEDGSRS